MPLVHLPQCQTTYSPQCYLSNHCHSALLYLQHIFFTCALKYNQKSVSTNVMKTCTGLTSPNKPPVTFPFMPGIPQRGFFVGLSGDKHVGCRFHSSTSFFTRSCCINSTHQKFVFCFWITLTFILTFSLTQFIIVITAKILLSITVQQNICNCSISQT